MYLGFISSIKEYFANLGDASFLDLIPFIIGIVMGFILCLLVYFLIFLTSFKTKKNKVEVIDIDDEIIKQRITNTKNQYIDEASSKKTNDKIIVLKDCSWNLINDIARIYYPDSPHPIFELSIEELISLDYYIMKRIETLFSGKILSKVKKLKVTSVLNLIDIKKKYDENKVVKAANKMKVKGIAKTLWSIVNIINPVYWVKRIMFDAPFQLIVNKIALTVIDIIGAETSKVYSKNAFVEEDTSVEEQVKEIEKMLGGESDEC